MDVNEILGRLMTYAGVKNDTALAKKMGYKNQSTIGNWRQKNRPELGKILDAFPEIDLNWLVRGDEEKARAGVPLIPMEAVAGYGVEAYQDLPIEDYYSVFEFKLAAEPSPAVRSYTAVRPRRRRRHGATHRRARRARP